MLIRFTVTYCVQTICVILKIHTSLLQIAILTAMIKSLINSNILLIHRNAIKNLALLFSDPAYTGTDFRKSTLINVFAADRVSNCEPSDCKSCENTPYLKITIKNDAVSKLLCTPTTPIHQKVEGLRKNCEPRGVAPLPPQLRPGELSPEPTQPVVEVKNRNRYIIVYHDNVICQLLIILRKGSSFKDCIKTSQAHANIPRIADHTGC